MTDKLQTMADLLLELERELRHLEFWSEGEPTAEMLASVTPFASDRLVIEQWLQWVFVPRIKSLIETDSQLPTSCDIHPYAEECLKGSTDSSASLLQILLRIDRHISTS